MPNKKWPWCRKFLITKHYSDFIEDPACTHPAASFWYLYTRSGPSGRDHSMPSMSTLRLSSVAFACAVEQCFGVRYLLFVSCYLVFVYFFVLPFFSRITNQFPCVLSPIQPISMCIIAHPTNLHVYYRPCRRDVDSSTFGWPYISHFLKS